MIIQVTEQHKDGTEYLYFLSTNKDKMSISDNDKFKMDMITQAIKGDIDWEYRNYVFEGCEDTKQFSTFFNLLHEMHFSSDGGNTSIEGKYLRVETSALGGKTYYLELI